MSQLLATIPHVLTSPVIRILFEDIDFVDFSPRWVLLHRLLKLLDWRILGDQCLNVLVEREVLNSARKTAAGHVELLVNGFHLLSQDVNLLDGEWFEKVLHVDKWFHLQVS